MSSRTRKQTLILLKNEIEVWGKQLGIDQTWRYSHQLVAKSEMAETDSTAEVSWPTNYRNAKIKFNEEKLRELTDAEIHRIVGHEMLHMVFAPIRDQVSYLLGDGTTSLQILQGEEQVIDTIANLLTP